jgi:hypothetical protein
MSWGVSQARGERANVRAKQEFCRAIQGVPGYNVLFRVDRELVPIKQ